MSYEPSFLRDACVLVLTHLIVFYCAWKMAKGGEQKRIIAIAGKAHKDGYEQGLRDAHDYVQEIEKTARETDANARN